MTEKELELKKYIEQLKEIEEIQFNYKSAASIMIGIILDSLLILILLVSLKASLTLIEFLGPSFLTFDIQFLYSSMVHFIFFLAIFISIILRLFSGLMEFRSNYEFKIVIENKRKKLNDAMKEHYSKNGENQIE
jgi:hypothetical protein